MKKPLIFVIMLYKLNQTKQKLRGEVMIAKFRTKVKTIIEKVVSKGNKLGKATKPVEKFIMEGTMGMILSGSSNLTKIAGTLKEKTELKHTLKRLQRMSSKHEILNLINKICLHFASKEANEKTLLILDGGDICHMYGEKFEDISTVRDGSKKTYSKGYFLNQILGYNPVSNTSYPILLEMYSSVRDGFESANKEAFQIIRQTVESVGNKPLWAMDRGYDDSKYFGLMEELESTFIIRMKSNRNVIIKGKAANIFEVASKINRRYKYKNYGKYGTKKVVLKVPINKKLEEREFTLISFKGKNNKQISYYLTSGYVKSMKEIKRRLSGYFKRWSIEEGYRFEKQGFGIEKSTVRNFTGIRSLLGLTLLSWLTLFIITKEERLKEEILHQAKVEKTKPKDRPKFIYYRLLNGVQELFIQAKSLFNFRLSKEEKLLKKIKSEERAVFTLFDNILHEVG